jgi:hypothetical protein
MKNQASRALALALGVGLAQHALADGKIQVQSPAVLDANAGVGDAIKRECELEEKTTDWVMEALGGRAERLDRAGGGDVPVLKLTIVSVIGASGGAWSGPKTMSVRAELVESGKVVATTVKTRSSSGGAFAGYKSTCAIFGRVMKTLGSDIAGWARGETKGR